jgi:hypothetical protein
MQWLDRQVHADSIVNFKKVSNLCKLEDMDDAQIELVIVSCWEQDDWISH